MLRPETRSASLAPLAARSITLAISVIVNLGFLRIAASRLNVNGFGALTVVLSVAAAVQFLDFGIQSYFVAYAAPLISRGDRVRLRNWFTAILGGSVACAIVLGPIIAFTFVVKTSDPSLVNTALAVGLVGAVSANVSGIPLSHLLAHERVSAYYYCYLSQPVTLIVVGLLAYKLNWNLVGFVAASGIASVLPGLCGLAIERVRVGTAAVAGPGVLQIFAKSTPIGMRQGTSLVAFGFTPVIGGLVGGSVAAAQIAVPFRVYSACWSVVGVPYHASWADMSVRAGARDAKGVRALSRTVSLRAGSTALIVGLFSTPVGYEVGREVVSGAAPSVGLYLIATLGLVMRSLFLGATLVCATGGPGYVMAAVEFVAVITLDVGLVALPGPSAAALCTATLVLAALVTALTTCVRARSIVRSMYVPA